MKIIWTKHAEDRQKEWEKKVDITREKVEDLVNSPEQVVPGDTGVLVAQTKYRIWFIAMSFYRDRHR